MISIKPAGYWGRKVPAERLARYLRSGLPTKPEGPGAVSGWSAEQGPDGPSPITDWTVALGAE